MLYHLSSDACLVTLALIAAVVVGLFSDTFEVAELLTVAIFAKIIGAAVLLTIIITIVSHSV